MYRLIYRGNITSACRHYSHDVAFKLTCIAIYDSYQGTVSLKISIAYLSLSTAGEEDYKKCLSKNARSNRYEVH